MISNTIDTNNNGDFNEADEMFGDDWVIIPYGDSRPDISNLNTNERLTRATLDI
jgi:hypothetical protein